MSKTVFKCVLASSVAVGALVWGASAQAQTTAAPKAEATPSLAEVVVTAQRRGENLQNVPVAVNSISAGQLQKLGAQSSEDLNLVPGVVYGPAVAGGGITIRGIGGKSSGTDEPANAIYVDGVYQFAPTAGLFQFSGIERLEVLKGPQGTLFGRNTAGGVVQVITRDPGRAPTGEVEVGAGSYGMSQGSLYVSTPITDTVGVNLSAFGVNQSHGWGHDYATGAEIHKGYTWGVHSKLKWAATDGKTDFTLSGLYTRDIPVASSIISIAPGTNDFAGIPSKGLFNSNSNLAEYRSAEQYTYSGTFHRDLGFARLTTVSAYDTVNAFVLTDGDGGPIPILNVKLKNSYYAFTQEVLLQSKEGSRLQWTIGGFAMSGSTNGVFDLGFLTNFTKTWTNSYAGFGQATYAVTDDTKVTAGIRYTVDPRRMAGTSTATPPFDVHRTDSKPSWRLAIDHKFSDRVMAYASYSRGFKSGVFNGTTPLRPPAAPTSLDAYEVGVKSEAFERRLRVNAAVFYYDYKQVQLELFGPSDPANPNSSFGAFFANAGTARSYGLDLDAAAEPIRNLTLTAGLSLLDAKFTSNTLLTNYFITPVNIPSTGPTDPGHAAGSVATLPPSSIKGKYLSFSPTSVVSLGADYKYETNAGDFDLTGEYSHNSGYFADPTNFAPFRTKAFDMVNASVTWTSPSSALHASVWAKNLADERRVAGGELGAGLSNGGIYPMAPRTYGVTVGAKF